MHTPADRRRERGFTYSELAVVVAVFAILIAITIVSVNGIDDESAKGKCQTELRELRAASERFKAELGFYPPDDQALQDAGMLDLSETPNYEVEAVSADEGPRYLPVGDRCDRPDDS